jgi:putative ATP-binding cassette transporter
MLMEIPYLDFLFRCYSGPTFHLSGRSFAIPGYMVWCALVYAGTASRLSWRVGPPDYAPAPFH